MGSDARCEPAVRVFFALVPPPALRHALGVLAAGVAQRAHGRAVPGDNLHVTLAFIGAWPVSRLSHWIDVGARCAGAAMHVTLDRLGGFRRAGVAWIGTGTTPPALRELEGRAKDVGLPPLDRLAQSEVDLLAGAPQEGDLQTAALQRHDVKEARKRAVATVSNALTSLESWRLMYCAIRGH